MLQDAKGSYVEYRCVLQKMKECGKSTTVADTKNKIALETITHWAGWAVLWRLSWPRTCRRWYQAYRICYPAQAPIYWPQTSQSSRIGRLGRLLLHLLRMGDWLL